MNIGLTFTTNVKPSDAKRVDDLYNALNKLESLELDSAFNDKLSNMGKALSSFTGIKIGVNLGKSVGNLVDAVNQMDNVRDISPYADNLEKGFAAISNASKNFEGNSGKIPVTLGRAVSGIVDSLNKLKEVKDISPYADNLENNFRTIATATRQFNGMNGADYSGISRLVTTMTSIDKIKPVSNTVVKNAEMLAKAINVLDTNVTMSTPRLEAMSQATRTVASSLQKADVATNKWGGSLKLVNFAVIMGGIRTVVRGLESLVSRMYSSVDAFGSVQNTLSFFTQSLGSEANKTAAIIQQYADFGVVDFTQFGDQVAKLNQMYRSYGIGAEDSAKMALNLTQLAYDASYALGENGKDLEKWFGIVTSVSTGQARAGYALGVDTRIKALSENFEGLSGSTDMASRSMAVYETIIENTTAIQGQLTKEFGNTYVQMDVLKNRVRQLSQSVGQALIPVFQEVIKWGLVLIKVVELIIDSMVKLFGGKGFELINYENMINGAAGSTGNLSNATDDVASGLGNANKQAKELKKTIGGMDQVFTINDKQETPGAGSGSGGIGGLPSGGVSGYDWLDALATGENMKALQEIQGKAESIVKTLREALPWVVGIGTGFASWKIAKGLMDGLKWISELKGISGGLGFDKLTFGVGIGLFISNLLDFKEAIDILLSGEGDMYTVADAITSFVGMIASAALATGNIKVAGILFVVQGLVEVMVAIKAMTEEGVSWENVDRVIGGLSNLAIGIGLLKGKWALVGTGLVMKGALEIIGQIIENWDQIKTGDFSGLMNAEMLIAVIGVVAGIAIAIGKFTTSVKPSIPKIKEAPASMETVSSSTGQLSSKLTGMAKNLGMAILILAEVIIFAGLFVGGIWALGKGLEQVGIAWAPVLADAGNIAAGIVLGTALLVAIGVAAFALGSATVGSAGSIPIAIGVGTAMLVLLETATLIFIGSLTATAYALANELAPQLEELNAVMPSLNENLRNYTLFMIEFAGHMVAQTASNAISGIAGIVDTIVGWFTKDPIKKMANDAKKNVSQFTSLNKELGLAVPLVKKGNDLLGEYFSLLEQLHTNAQSISDLGTPAYIGNEFKAFSSALKTGFSDLDDIKTRNVASIMAALRSLDLNKFRGIGKDIVTAMELGITSHSFNLASVQTKIRNAFTFSTTPQGTALASGVVNGINNSYVNISSFTNKVRSGMTFSTASSGTDAARSLVNAINSYSVNIGTFTGRVKSGLNFYSYGIGQDIAIGVQNGINGWYPNLTTFTNRLKRGMRVSFQIFSPSRWAETAIGAEIGAGVGVGINETEIDFQPFKAGIDDGLNGIMGDIEVQPRIAMPMIDTSQLSGSVETITQEFDANIKGKFEYRDDGNQRATENLTKVTIELLDRLIRAVEAGQIIEIDGEAIGKKGLEAMRNDMVRNNKGVLGK